jgi:hypothetical protein
MVYNCLFCEVVDEMELRYSQWYLEWLGTPCDYLYAGATQVIVALD